MPPELNVLALVKGREHYIYLYEDESRMELVRAIRVQAADPDLTLSWFDAAVLTERREATVGVVADVRRVGRLNP